MVKRIERVLPNHFSLLLYLEQEVANYVGSLLSYEKPATTLYYSLHDNAVIQAINNQEDEKQHALVKQYRKPVPTGVYSKSNSHVK